MTHASFYADGMKFERKAIVDWLRNMAGEWKRNGDANHDNDARLLRTAADRVEAGKHFAGEQGEESQLTPDELMERSRRWSCRDTVDGHDIVLFSDGPGEWYARGIDIDYIAQGDNREEAKTSFERGWKATVKAQKVWRESQ